MFLSLFFFTGHFGCVFHGTLLEADGQKQHCAIKSLNREYRPQHDQKNHITKSLDQGCVQTQNERKPFEAKGFRLGRGWMIKNRKGQIFIWNMAKYTIIMLRGAPYLHRGFQLKHT